LVRDFPVFPIEWDKAWEDAGFCGKVWDNAGFCGKSSDKVGSDATKGDRASLVNAAPSLRHGPVVFPAASLIISSHYLRRLPDTASDDPASPSRASF
jgi:hypothetical protein